MFCPNCANEVNPDLRYCNGCGYRIENGSASDKSAIARSLAKAVGWIGVSGLLIFVFVLGMLLASGGDEGVVVVTAFLYLASVFGICIYILKYIKSIDGGISEFKNTQSSAPGEISKGNTHQLEPPRTPPASVVDNTTRTLEEVPVKRQT